jgi:hypothetical protein
MQQESIAKKRNKWFPNTHRWAIFNSIKAAFVWYAYVPQDYKIYLKGMNPWIQLQYIFTYSTKEPVLFLSIFIYAIIKE